MKCVLTITIALFLLAVSGSAVFAGEPVAPISWYGRVSMGFAEQTRKYVEVYAGESEWDFKSGLNFAVAAGYTIPYIALEAEFSARKMDIARMIDRNSGVSTGYSGDQTQMSFMMNGYFIPKPEWEISPHIGLGVGTTFVSWNDVRAPGGPAIDDTDMVFTYQLIAGASYRVSPQFTLVADYRYFVPGDVEIDMNGTEGKLNNQELNIFTISLKFKL